MELVPIIYTSLIIVGILITATIIVSYISYRIKQGQAGNLKVYEKYKFEADKPKPGKKISRSPQEIKSRKRRPERKAEDDKKRIPSKTNKKQSDKDKFRSPDKHSQKPVKSADNKIEVISDLSGKKRPDTQEKKKKTNTTPNKKNEKVYTVGDDVFEKYSDDDDELYTFKTDNKK